VMMSILKLVNIQLSTHRVNIPQRNIESNIKDIGIQNVWTTIIFRS